jgi:LPS export ABC transporter protein LptC
MKSWISKFRSYSSIAALILTGMIVMSCEKKIPVIPKSDLLALPSLTVKDFRTTLTDSGRVQLIMSSPLVEQYDKADPKFAEFRQGIKVDIFNGKPNPESNVTAKFAKCTDNNLWELRDSVVVINEKNEKLETELLFWNQEKDRIYTDRFVKITSTDEVIQGIGFESDSHLVNRKILKVTADITLPNEK